MKNPKVVYKIQRPNFENVLEISIDLEQLEAYGLADYLYQNKLIEDINAKYTVLSRYVILPQKENNQKTFTKKQSFSNEGQNKFEFKKQLPLKQFRVELHSNKYFRDEVNVPKYVDVSAHTKGRAMMIAMNKVGFTDFPEGWGDMNVIPGYKASDWGVYSLGDENNAFLKQKEFSE